MRIRPPLKNDHEPIGTIRESQIDREIETIDSDVNRINLIIYLTKQSR